MIGELQPYVAPRWKQDSTGAWVPDLDDNGVQQMFAYPTYHDLPWPADSSVSGISAQTWFTLVKGWSDKLNPVSGILYFMGEKDWVVGKPGGSPTYLQTLNFTLGVNVRQTWELPKGTTNVGIELAPHYHAVGYCFEVRAK